MVYEDSDVESHNTHQMKHGTRDRLWFWRLAHYWSVVRLRRRVILAAIALGLLAAAVITLSTRPAFQARVVIHDAGVDSTGHITNPPPPHGIEGEAIRIQLLKNTNRPAQAP